MRLSSDRFLGAARHSRNRLLARARHSGHGGPRTLIGTSRRDGIDGSARGGAPRPQSPAAACAAARRRLEHSHGGRADPDNPCSPAVVLGPPVSAEPLRSLGHSAGALRDVARLAVIVTLSTRPGVACGCCAGVDEQVKHADLLVLRIRSSSRGGERVGVHQVRSLGPRPRSSRARPTTRGVVEAYPSRRRRGGTARPLIRTRLITRTPRR